MRLLSGEERAALAVLNFLRETKFGEFISVAALVGGRGEELADPVRRRERRGGRAPPRMPLVRFLSTLGDAWGEGDRGAPLWRGIARPEVFAVDRWSGTEIGRAHV